MKKRPEATAHTTAVNTIIHNLLSADLPEGWISDQASDSFVPTVASRTILSRLRDAAEQHYGFAIVHGPAGCSKTITTKFFVERGGHMFIRAHPEFSPTALLEEIAIGLRITRTRNFRALISMVRESLAARPKIIAIDEAQLATRQTLETMKYLADETNSTFVLVTTDEFVQAIRRWRDIESRVGVTAGVGNIPKKELLELYLDSGFHPEVVGVIHELCGGIMRDVLRLEKQIDAVIGANETLTREVIIPDHVRAISTKLNLSGGRA
jgi:hypothetical protein